MVLLGGTVYSPKHLKKSFVLFWLDSNSCVCDGHTEFALNVIKGDQKANGPLFREFQRVFQQVNEYLLKAQPVSFDETWHKAFVTLWNDWRLL